MKDEVIQNVDPVSDPVRTPQVAPSLKPPKLIDDAQPQYRIAVGIMNQYGDMWTYNVFESVEGAKASLRRFWNKKTDVGRYFIVPVEVMVKAIGLPIAVWPAPDGAASRHTPQPDHKATSE